MVENITDTVNFYVNQLGFTLQMSVNEDKSEFKAELDSNQAYIWAQLLCGDVEIMLQRRDSLAEDVTVLENASIGASATFYIRVEGVETLYSEYAKKDINIIKPLTTTWYGMQEFYVEDNNGYILCFGEIDSTTQV